MNIFFFLLVGIEFKAMTLANYELIMKKTEDMKEVMISMPVNR